jgi:hypothetical protein
MATEIALFQDSFKAENDLSSNQFKCVELSAEDQVDTCDGTTDFVLGVLQNKPLAGEAAEVMIYGVTKAVSDGTTPISVGDPLGVDTSGRVVKITAAAGAKSLGRALQASSAAGTIISVLLTPGVYTSA